MSEYTDKLRSIGTMRHRGGKKKTAVRNEDTGHLAGHHVEHWDDRQDAYVYPEAVRLNVSIKPKEAG